MKILNSLILSLLGFSHCFINPFKRVYSTVQKWKEHQISCLSFFKEFWYLCVPSRHSVGIHWRNLSCHSALSVSVFLQYPPNILSYFKHFPIASPPKKNAKAISQVWNLIIKKSEILWPKENKGAYLETNVTTNPSIFLHLLLRVCLCGVVWYECISEMRSNPQDSRSLLEYTLPLPMVTEHTNYKKIS